MRRGWRWFTSVPWSDLGELAGVALIAVALAMVHPALGVGAAGLYLVVASNDVRPVKRPERREERQR